MVVCLQKLNKYHNNLDGLCTKLSNITKLSETHEFLINQTDNILPLGIVFLIKLVWCPHWQKNINMSNKKFPTWNFRNAWTNFCFNHDKAARFPLTKVQKTATEEISVTFLFMEMKWTYVDFETRPCETLFVSTVSLKASRIIIVVIAKG